MYVYITQKAFKLTGLLGKRDGQLIIKLDFFFYRHRARIHASVNGGVNFRPTLMKALVSACRYQAFLHSL